MSLCLFIIYKKEITFLLQWHCSWAYLEVSTSDSHEDMTQAYAAGLVEGRLSAELLQFSLYNAEEGYCNNDLAHEGKIFRLQTINSVYTSRSTLVSLYFYI